MKKYIAPIIIVFVIVVGAIVWQFGMQKAQTSKTLEPVTVRLKWLHQSQFAGMYVADQKGFYADAGIKVRLLPFDFKDYPIDDVVAGRAQFGIVGADEILLARAEGKPVKAIAVIYQDSPVVAYSLTSSHIVKPVDFIGKKVGFQKGGNTEFVVRGLLDYIGVKDTQYTGVDVGFDPSDLISGKVDVSVGYITNEPISAEEQGHPINIINPSEYGINLYADVLFTSEDMIVKDPDLVKRFTQATLKGWNYALLNVDEAVNDTLKYPDANNKELNFAHQKKLLEKSIPFIQPSKSVSVGQMEYELWNKTYWFVKNYYFGAKKTSVADAYTTEFLQP
jgi:ABC-type nitrate/sulfonate/bicarbonate transport system substrate-binding protein